MKTLKRGISVILTLAIMLTGILTLNVSMVHAADQTIKTVGGVANFLQGDAKIAIKGNNGQSLIGKKFRVYKLFLAENAVGGESINYKFNPLYETAIKKVVAADMTERGTTTNANDITEYMAIDYINNTYNTHKVEGAYTDQELEGRTKGYRVFVEKLRDEIERENLDTTYVVVENVTDANDIVLNTLAFGYYVIDEVSDVEGQHVAASLCMVDTANPNSEIQIKSDYPGVVKKIQEDDNDPTINNPDRWNDIADFETGQTVPYQYTSTIPNINGYSSYKYGWHDVMDECLTFDADSVKIEIIGLSEGRPKTYTLSPSEFIVDDSGIMNETFIVTVNDIKAIIDREFNNKNVDGDNVYGQAVKVTYNASINEKAALKTGRPGFENDVRLEFSNDPDSDGEGKTGFTPWDTVVCFTYRLDVLKTNDKDLQLKDAYFRLYSDEECKNEVYVKEVADGYMVINRDAVGGDNHTGGSVPEDAVEMVSKEDGTLVVYGLDTDTYYLKETKAPVGYRLLLDPIKITLDATFTEERDSYVKGDAATDKTLKEFTASAHVKTFYDGLFKENDQSLTTDVEKGQANITVINKVGIKLPVTGTPALMIITVMGVALMATGIIVSKKKKGDEKKSDEE